jgi:hypothetical protein
MGELSGYRSDRSEVLGGARGCCRRIFRGKISALCKPSVNIADRSFSSSLLSSFFSKPIFSSPCLLSPLEALADVAFHSRAQPPQKPEMNSILSELIRIEFG